MYLPVSIMWLMYVCILLNLVRKGKGFVNVETIFPLRRQQVRIVNWMSTTSMDLTDVTSLSWSDLQSLVGETSVGKALNIENSLRMEGKGSPHVQNKLRKFDLDDEPAITLFRDHAGW
jgi:hypothetical protein